MELVARREVHCDRIRLNDIAHWRHSPNGYALVDITLLYSILSNLLSNAIKYSPHGGSIDFALVCEPYALTFQIRDEGIGIPPEVLQTLYEPFQWGGNTKGILGTGLGLAVVKKYLDLHQGQIFVESEVGVGTTFTVTIPQATSAITAMASRCSHPIEISRYAACDKEK